MSEAKLVCWEVLDGADPVLADARRLYEATQEPDEAIPWAWMAGAPDRRRGWRPGRTSPHLLLAGRRGPKGSVGAPLGFAYGLHVPAYGGYACYLGVEPRQRLAPAVGPQGIDADDQQRQGKAEQSFQ